MDLEHYTPIVDRWWPGAADRALRLETGQDHDVVVIDDAVVVRFARGPAVTEVAREARLLRLLARLELDVPLPEVLDERESFLVQRYLDGEVLREPTVTALGPLGFTFTARTARLLDTLAAVPLTPALCDELAAPPDWQAFATRVVDELVPLMSPEGASRARAEAAAVAGMRIPGHQVLVHGDLGGNLLWDADERRISGLLDWTHAHPGDPAYDLASLAAVAGWELAGAVDAQRPEPQLERARVYAGTFALQEALVGVSRGDSALVDAGLAGYR